MKYLFVFIILISFKVLANHTKIDNDLINLMSNNKSTEIGINYIKQHEYDKAINFFLLEVDKKNMDGSVNLGLIYEYLKNDYIKAEKYYNLSAFSNNAYGQYNLGILYYIWKSIFAATVNYDLAAAEGMKPDVSNFIFTLLLAGVIAISLKMIGALLITGLLLIPAATARSLSNNPSQMVILSILIGIVSVMIGLFSSLEFNTASGRSIIVAGLVLFILSLIPFKRSSALQR